MSKSIPSSVEISNLSGKMKNLPTIPIVVLNWNGIEDTRECLHSLEQLDYPDFKVVLLDNASDNGEGESLRQDFGEKEGFEVHLYEDNLGFTGAHNRIVPQLIEQGYEYIALLNNDTVADRQWLRQLVKVAMAGSADVVSTKLINYYDRRELDNVGHQMLSTGEIVPIGHQGDPNDYQEEVENFGSCAGATLYSVSMIRDLGFFDPYFSTGYEDAEFGARAVIAGYRCVLAPEAKVYHKISRSVSKIKTNKYELMIRNAIWYTYLKLVPREVVKRKLPVLILKQIMVMVVHLTALDMTSLRLTWQGLKNFRSAYAASSETWVSKRIDTGKPILDQKELKRRQTPFFWHDVRRFVHVYSGGASNA